MAGLGGQAAEPGPCGMGVTSLSSPRLTWRCFRRRAVGRCGRWSAGFVAAVTKTVPAYSRSSGRPGETPAPGVTVTLQATSLSGWGCGGTRLAGSCPGRGEYGAGGSVLLPPSPQCPSEDRLLPFSSWRFTFYLIAFIAGMAVIVDVSIGPPAPSTCLALLTPPAFSNTSLSLPSLHTTETLVL